MRLSARRLNRTLLRRQHLLERSPLGVEAMVHHLVGLQAQEMLPPYLSLHARLADLDPYDVSRGLEQRTLVRLVTMRGTIHLLTADDALTLRRWTQPHVQERELRASQAVRPAMGVDRDAFRTAVAELLADGPLPQRDLGSALADRFPGVPATALGQLARVLLPLAQLPPRGTWKGSGTVVYQCVDQWLGRPMADPDVEQIVRRYLRAFGPATAADVTAWSGVTRLGPVLAGMALVRHEDEDGRALYDVSGAPLADEDEPAPPRLLGTYDNLWLSHAARDRVTAPDKRKRWMGSNGGVAMALFVNGMLEGLWRAEDGRVVVREMFRDLTARERSALDDEIARVEGLLAR